MEPRNVQYSTTEYTEDTVKSSMPNLSAVSWSAIIAGAAAAAALSLIFIVLGVGLGLSFVSPWADSGLSGTEFGISSILWVTLTSVFASALGGYVAGRLRRRWIGTPNDEVYFRDTAHGFLTWAVATLIAAGLLGSTISSILSGAAQTGAVLAGTAGAATAATMASENASSGASSNQNGGSSLDYFMDSLMRKDASRATAMNTENTETENMQNTNPSTSTFRDQSADPSDEALGSDTETDTGSDTSSGDATNTSSMMNNSRMADSGRMGSMMNTRGGSSNDTYNNIDKNTDSAASKMEVARIFVNGLASDQLPQEDLRYAGQIVAQHAEISQQNAEQRVVDTFNTLLTKKKEAQAALDQAREVSAYSTLWIFISLLMGAFVACLAAVWGGRQRDC
jgi:hypothetical protein